MTERLNVYSVFKSIQGESTYAGMPTGFVRLTGCPLHCVYCDSQKACLASGTPLGFSELISRLEKLHVSHVTLTGGEPLAQRASLGFLRRVCDQRWITSLETSGALNIEGVDQRVKIVMDLKTPGSGMESKQGIANLPHLKEGMDEIKFVVCDRRDFDWAVGVADRYELWGAYEVLISAAAPMVTPTELAGWILDSGQSFRLQLQLHKFLWPEGENEGGSDG